MHRDSNHEHSNDSRTELEQLRRRQTLRIALALFLVWIALTASSNAAGPCETPNTIGLPIQLDGFTPSPVDTELAAVQSQAAAYVQLHAVLSNFDRDANADGWRVSVVLRSRDGSVLAAPSQATFEILELANLARVDRFGRNSASYPFVRCQTNSDMDPSFGVQRTWRCRPHAASDSCGATKVGLGFDGNAPPRYSRCRQPHRSFLERCRTWSAAQPFCNSESAGRTRLS